MFYLNHIVSSIFLIIQLAPSYMEGQSKSTLSLIEAYTLLDDRYPLLKNAFVISEIHQSEKSLIEKESMPSLYFKGDGRLQSESVHLDVPEDVTLPFEIDQPIYSVRVYAEAQYNLLDGGLQSFKEELNDINLELQKHNLEVDRYALKQRINALFVNLDLTRKQITLYNISLDDLAHGMASVSAGVENGVLLESELTKLQVKELELNSHKQNLTYRIEGLVNTLSDLLDTDIEYNVHLDFPSFGSFQNIPNINRPEQQLFDVQRKSILARGKLIDVQKEARLDVFAQTGVGSPNPLNFLDENVAPFALVGLQFNWRITDWKKDQIEKDLLRLEAEKVRNVQEAFEFNLETQESNYFAEVQRIQNQIANETKIGHLHSEILDQLGVQLDEGIITSTEYLEQLNTELRSRQKIVIYQSQLRQVQLNFWNERGAL